MQMCHRAMVSLNPVEASPLPTGFTHSSHGIVHTESNLSRQLTPQRPRWFLPWVTREDGQRSRPCTYTQAHNHAPATRNEGRFLAVVHTAAGHKCVGSALVTRLCTSSKRGQLRNDVATHFGL